MGSRAEFDLLRARVNRDNARPAVITQRAAREIAYLRLKQLLGVPLTDSLVLTSALEDSTLALPRRASEFSADTALDASRSREALRNRDSR